MGAKKLLTDFVFAFALTLVVGVVVTFIWNFVFHDRGAPDWETVFRLAIILGIALPLVKLHPRTEKAA